jgi:hypothetical protein
MSIPTNFKPITDPSIPTYSSPNLDDVFHIVDVSDTTDSAAGTSKRAKLSDVLALVSPLSIDTTKTALATLITNSEITIGAKYRITNATAGVIWVWGVDANVISTNAALEGDYDGTTSTVGSWGDYDLATDTFTGINLQKVSDAGGFDNSTNIIEGPLGGIALLCTVNLKLEWFQGALYSLDSSDLIDKVQFKTVAPSVNDDSTRGFKVGSYWETNDGTMYVCSDATTGAAEWVAQSGNWTPTLDNPLGAVTSVNGVILAFFTVSGNVCTVTIYGAIAVDFSSLDSGDFTFTLPIPSSTPTAIGVVNLNVPNQVNGLVSGGRIKLYSNDTTFDTASNPIEFTAIFQYLITP